MPVLHVRPPLTGVRRGCLGRCLCRTTFVYMVVDIHVTYVPQPLVLAVPIGDVTRSRVHYAPPGLGSRRALGLGLGLHPH